jgi:aminotransferase
LGYIIAPENIIERAKKVHDFLTVGAAAPLMEAAVVGLNMDQSYYDGLLYTYDEKRKLFLNGLDDLNIAHTTPEGAYYVMLDVSEFKGYDTDIDFCVKLAEKVGVGAVPGSAFYNVPEYRFIRMHFAKSKETLELALNKLENMKKYM